MKLYELFGFAGKQRPRVRILSRSNCDPNGRRAGPTKRCEEGTGYSTASWMRTASRVLALWFTMPGSSCARVNAALKPSVKFFGCVGFAVPTEPVKENVLKGCSMDGPDLAAKSVLADDTARVVATNAAIPTSIRIPTAGPIDFCVVIGLLGEDNIGLRGGDGAAAAPPSPRHRAGDVHVVARCPAQHRRAHRGRRTIPRARPPAGTGNAAAASSTAPREGDGRCRPAGLRGPARGRHRSASAQGSRACRGAGRAGR